MRSLLKALAWIGGILAVIGAVLYYTLLDYWVVSQDDPLLALSIQPTMHAGDRVLLLRSSEPHSGNLARCPDPDQPGRFVVGRVVAAGGETVAVGEIVQVNGRNTSSHFGCDPVTMVHPTSNEEVTLTCSVVETGATFHPTLRNLEHPEPTRTEKVEEGKLFLVSDNHHIHLDSREFGAVPAAGCKTVVMRLMSAQGWSDSKARFSFLW